LHFEDIVRQRTETRDFSVKLAAFGEINAIGTVERFEFDLDVALQHRLAGEDITRIQIFARKNVAEVGERLDLTTRLTVMTCPEGWIVAENGPLFFLKKPNINASPDGN